MRHARPAEFGTLPGTPNLTDFLNPIGLASACSPNPNSRIRGFHHFGPFIWRSMMARLRSPFYHKEIAVDLMDHGPALNTALGYIAAFTRYTIACPDDFHYRLQRLPGRMWVLRPKSPDLPHSPTLEAYASWVDEYIASNRSVPTHNLRHKHLLDAFTQGYFIGRKETSS